MPERASSAERLLLKIGKKIGLQARLLLGGDFLDPSKNVKDPVKPEQLNITGDTYKPLETLSGLERKQFWKDKEENDFASQKTAWAAEVVGVMDSQKDYFESEVGKNRKELYKKLLAGTGVNLDGFDQDAALKIYGHFFHQDRRGKEVESFVEDILKLDIYQKTEEGKFNFARVEEDLEAYSWLGKIFGNQTSLFMAEFTSGLAKLKDKDRKKEFVEELNTIEGSQKRWFGLGSVGGVKRIDNLRDDEKDPLEYLHKAIRENRLPDSPRSVPPPAPITPDDAADDDPAPVVTVSATEDDDVKPKNPNEILVISQRLTNQEQTSVNDLIANDDFQKRIVEKYGSLSTKEEKLTAIKKDLSLEEQLVASMFLNITIKYEDEDDDDDE